MEPSAVLGIARQRAAAVSARDFGAVTRMLTDDIVWHQPGRNQFSGSHRGAAEIGEMFGGTMTVTKGTFEPRTSGDPMVNGELVAKPVRYSARCDGELMGLNGVDPLRSEGDRIAEVWLFSAGQGGEDAFGAPPEGGSPPWKGAVSAALRQSDGAGKRRPLPVRPGTCRVRHVSGPGRCRPVTNPTCT